MKRFLTKYDLVRMHNITEDEANSLVLYKGSYYENINHYLRTNVFVADEKIPSLPELKHHIKNIERAMNPLSKNMVVYRGIPSNYEDLITGTYEYVDTAFMSTTTDIEQAYKFTKGKECCIFEIKVPKGTMAFDFQDLESEVLLESGMKLVDFSYKGIVQTTHGLRLHFKCNAEKMDSSTIKKYREKYNKIEKDIEKIAMEMEKKRTSMFDDLMSEIEDEF